MKILRIIMLLSLLTTSLAQAVPTDGIAKFASGKTFDQLVLRTMVKKLAEPILKAALPQSNKPSLWRKALLPAVFLAPIALNSVFKTMNNYPATNYMGLMGSAATGAYLSVLDNRVAPLLAFCVEAIAFKAFFDVLFIFATKTAVTAKNLVWENQELPH